jgi:hypothetical protein
VEVIVDVHDLGTAAAHTRNNCARKLSRRSFCENGSGCEKVAGGSIIPTVSALKKVFYETVIAHVNRKDWWHVPPRDPAAYRKRGKFLASSFREAEFWGRPLDEPHRVSIVRPLIGDEQTIEKALFGKILSSDGISIVERWQVDAKIKKAAVAHGYDCILLMTPKAFSELKEKGKIPRTLELNIFR